VDAYDGLLLVLLAGTLGCFWRAWWSGELHDAVSTIRKRAGAGEPWPD
jgi:hypothetical protein